MKTSTLKDRDADSPSPVTDPLTGEAGRELYQQALALYDNIEREHCHLANVNGITMGYLDFGPEDGTPLIWAHGSGSNRYELLNVQTGLVQAGYRLICIDYRGHGKTQVEVTPYNTSLYHIADDIAALMDHLAIPKAVIGGLSKGGWVAAAFYDAYPDKVLGLLLEDGGSFSNLRLTEDILFNVVQRGPSPYHADAIATLQNPATRFKSRFEGVKTAWVAYSSALSLPRRQQLGLEYFALMLSLLHPTADKKWVYHCDLLKLMTNTDARPAGSSSVGAATRYSRLPIMQQSQELMNPFVVFRKLHVPMHIIDPDSPTDWMPARYQNEELQKLHPDLIVHEVYDYEHSPHEAHIETTRAVY